VVTQLDAAAESAILATLATVPDPEIPAVSVIDLGIVRGIRRHPPAVLITPTYTGCPATRVIEQSVRDALDAAGFAAIPVETILSPPWTTDWISDAGRAVVACPQCGSTETREVSRFGSTPCKALWRCLDCLEPFDRFKCH
jgi:ring-1,2-phenylacetyl-CoA epoxidase subunit PaaD